MACSRQQSELCLHHQQRHHSGEDCRWCLDVYDAHMNPVKNYRLPAKQFDQTIKQLNRFFK
jgi:zona occludens toxin (predicted ATPase)